MTLTNVEPTTGAADLDWWWWWWGQDVTTNVIPASVLAACVILACSWLYWQCLRVLLSPLRGSRPTRGAKPLQSTPTTATHFSDVDLSQAAELSRTASTVRKLEPILVLIIGCMFAGKSTENHRLMSRFRFSRYRTLYVKWAGDCKRAGDVKEPVVFTHTHGATNMRALAVVRLSDLPAEMLDDPTLAVIAVDEGQFFAPEELYAFFREHVIRRRRQLIVSGLVADMHGKPFPAIVGLVHEANRIVKLEAMCMRCPSEHGVHSHCFARQPPEQHEQDGAPLIGGSDMYQALCHHCFEDAQREDVQREDVQSRDR